MKYAVSFDFWNTLFGTGAESERRKLRLNYLRRKILHHKKIPLKAIESAFEASFDFFIEQWRDHHRTPGPDERIRLIAKILDIELTHNEIIQIVDYFGNLIFAVQPEKIDHIHQVVSDLALQYPLGIISDTGYISGKYIRHFLEKEHLLSYFTSLVFSDEHPQSKPHLYVFQTTCRNLGVSCKNLIHIGDLDQTDVLGVKNAGGISIKYVGKYHDLPTESAADYVIDHYQELPQLITSITTK